MGEILVPGDVGVYADVAHAGLDRVENLVWSPSTGITRKVIPPVPAEIAALMREVSVAGELVE